MKKSFVLSIAICLFSATAYANDSLASLLDTIKLQLHSEQWVTTKTALVNVIINASVNDKEIENLQTILMQKLNQLAKDSQWHIVSFDRSQEKSGLENIQIIAQARLPQTDLSNIRQKAKDMSKAGETYTIDSVQFIPSNEEMQQTSLNLRNNIYQQVKTEIDALNKQYPEQHYSLHQLDFTDTLNMEPMPMAQNTMYKAQIAGAASASTNRRELIIGNKMNVQATVILASLPTVITRKLAADNS